MSKSAQLPHIYQSKHLNRLKRPDLSTAWIFPHFSQLTLLLWTKAREALTGWWILIRWQTQSGGCTHRDQFQTEKEKVIFWCHFGCFFVQDFGVILFFVCKFFCPVLQKCKWNWRQKELLRFMLKLNLLCVCYNARRVHKVLETVFRTHCVRLTDTKADSWTII